VERSDIKFIQENGVFSFLCATTERLTKALLNPYFPGPRRRRRSRSRRKRSRRR
jgi:hypothetical protein